MDDFKELPDPKMTEQARAIIQKVPEIGRLAAEKELVKLQRRAKGIDKMLVSRYFEALAVYGFDDVEKP